MADWMPPLPERSWNMFCTKCRQSRRLDDKTELQHSEMHPGVAFAACPCGYTAFAEQAPYTTDQMRRAQADAARAALEQAARWVRNRSDAYDAEHGTTDPETGAREYPGTGEEYMMELAEIEGGIRALAKGIT